MTPRLAERHTLVGPKQSIPCPRRVRARALLQTTPCPVDNITEQIITANLGELRDKTAVIISHRLSAIKNADLILFMDEGEIIERGTHEELMKLGGRYHDMWIKQAETEEGDK